MNSLTISVRLQPPDLKTCPCRLIQGIGVVTVYNQPEVRPPTAPRRSLKRPVRCAPASVALDPKLIAELKSESTARGVPGQVLMRMFIVEGFKRLKRAS